MRESGTVVGQVMMIWLSALEGLGEVLWGVEGEMVFEGVFWLNLTIDREESRRTRPSWKRARERVWRGLRFEVGCGVGREGREKSRESDVLGSDIGELISSFLHSSFSLLWRRICSEVGSFRKVGLLDLDGWTTKEVLGDETMKAKMEEPYRFEDWRRESISDASVSGRAISKRVKVLGVGWKVLMGAKRSVFRVGKVVFRKERKEKGDGELILVREMSMVRKAVSSGVGSPSSSISFKRLIDVGEEREMCSDVLMLPYGVWEEERWIARMLKG